MTKKSGVEGRGCKQIHAKGGELGNQLKRPGLRDHELLINRKNQDMKNCVNQDIGNRQIGNRQDPQVRQTKSCFLLQCTALIVVFCVAVEYLFPPWIAEERAYLQLNNSIKVLQETFPNQTEYFWKVSLAAAKPVLIQKMPKHPGVILIAGPNRLKALTQCLVQRLSEAMNNAFEIKTPIVVFDSSQFKDSEGNDVKNQINNKFSTAFDDGIKVGIILEIESLPEKSPMIFYRLCDTANAPYRNVIIILTLNMEEEAQTEKDEAQVELRRLWEPVLDQDQVEPLFSRIGNNIAYVRDDQSNCFGL